MNQMGIEDTYTALLYELAFVSGFVAKAMFSSVGGRLDYPRWSKGDCVVLL